MLDWQTKELRTLAFDPVRWQDDNQEHRRLAHAASLLEGAGVALALLDENEAAATSQLDEASSAPEVHHRIRCDLEGASRVDRGGAHPDR